MFHYQGQIHELEVPVPAMRIDRTVLDALADSFGREHERTCGHRAGAGEPVELATAQVPGRALSERPRVPERVTLAGGEVEPGSRRAYYGRQLGWIDTPVVARAALVAAGRRAVHHRGVRLDLPRASGGAGGGRCKGESGADALRTQTSSQGANRSLWSITVRPPPAQWASSCAAPASPASRPAPLWPFVAYLFERYAA